MKTISDSKHKTNIKKKVQMRIKIVISTFVIVIDLKKRNDKYIFIFNQSNLTRRTLTAVRISLIGFLLLNGTGGEGIPHP